MKSIKKLIFIFSVVGIGCTQISFFVPQDHENFTVIDSLHNRMQILKLQVEKLETRLIDEDIRAEPLGVKEQYFRHQLKYNQVTTDNILEYFQALRGLNDVKINYFNKLLSALNGDLRAKCFILLKNTRVTLLQITGIIQRFDIPESNVNKITYSSNEMHVLSPSLNEPSLEKIDRK